MKTANPVCEEKHSIAEEVRFDNALEKSITNFNNDPVIQQLNALYYEKSLLEIMEINRSEIHHSNFISWLLNPPENHNLNDFPLKKFLEIIIKRKMLKPHTLPAGLLDVITSGEYTLYGTDIKREHSLGNNGRVDILIKTAIKPNTGYNGENNYKVRIVIENKVASQENGNQTQKYYDYYKEVNDGYVNLFVYLTPLSSIGLEKLEEPECECKEYIQINYQLLLNYILEPALEKGINESSKSKLRDYIRALSKPAFNDNETDNSREIIMAIGKEEKDLLINFWKNHRRLFAAIFKTFSEDVSLLEGDDHKLAEQLITFKETVALSKAIEAELDWREKKRAAEEKKEREREMQEFPDTILKNIEAMQEGVERDWLYQRYVGGCKNNQIDSMIKFFKRFLPGLEVPVKNTPEEKEFERYIKFYNELRDIIKNKVPVEKEPSGNEYYRISTNIGGVYLEWSFHEESRSSFSVGINFENDDRELYFDKISKLKGDIESQTHEEVRLQESSQPCYVNWFQRGPRIYIKRLGGEMTDDLKKWAVDNMILFYNIINKELAAGKAEFERYIKFYNELRDMIKDKVPVEKEPSGNEYYRISTNIGGVYLEWSFHGEPRSSFRVKIYFENADRYFGKISKLKDGLERRTHKKVVEEERKHAFGSSSYLYIEKQEGEMTDDLKKWAVDNMVIFYNIIIEALHQF